MHYNLTKKEKEITSCWVIILLCHYKDVMSWRDVTPWCHQMSSWRHIATPDDVIWYDKVNLHRQTNQSDDLTFSTWWPWPLTYDLDLQTHVTPWCHHDVTLQHQMMSYGITKWIYIGKPINQITLSTWQPWPLTYDLDLWTCLRYYHSQSSRWILGPYVKWFSRESAD